MGHHIEAKEEQDEGGIWRDRDQSDAKHQGGREVQNTNGDGDRKGRR